MLFDQTACRELGDTMRPKADSLLKFYDQKTLAGSREDLCTASDKRQRVCKAGPAVVPLLSLPGSGKGCCAVVRPWALEESDS